MVSRYTEHSTYLNHKNTQELLDGIVMAFKGEGMVRVDTHPKPLYHSPALKNNRWAVYILPGNSGWHLIQSTPYDLFSDKQPNSGNMRFLDISQNLKAPGFLIHAYEYGDVLVESDGQNAFSVSGGWHDYEQEPASDKYYGYEPNWPLAAKSRLLKKLFENSKNPDLCQYQGEEDIEIFSQYVASTLVRKDLFAADQSWQQGAIKLYFEWPAQDRPEPDNEAPLSYEKTPVLHYENGEPILPNDAVLYASDNRLYPARIDRFLYDGEYSSVLDVKQPGMLLYRNAKDLILVKRDCLDFVADCYEWLEKGAEQGNPGHQVILGNLYYLGRYLPKNMEKALYWLEKSAQQDQTMALEILGDIYLGGLEVKKDPYKGVQYLSKASKLGSETASYKLGCEYWEGKRVSLDGAKAIYWLTQAADQGHVAAQRSIGDWHGDDRQISKKNVAKSIKYFEMAAQKGDKESLYRLGLYFKNGDGVPQDYKHAAQLFKEAAEYSAVDKAKYEFAYMQEHGLGVEKNEAAAFQMYEFLAGHKKIPEAACGLAKMYIDGRHVKQDYEKARQYIQQAQNAKYRDAKYLLDMLPNGNFDKAKKILRAPEGYDIEQIHGLALDLHMGHYREHQTLAYALYLAAAERGHTDSQLQVGLMHLYGKGCEKNIDKALYWLKKSARKGYDDALRILGQTYLNGNGVKPNLKLATRYLRIAAILGNSIAKGDLKTIPFFKRIFYW